jgi:hypothetical protein
VTFLVETSDTRRYISIIVGISLTPQFASFLKDIAMNKLKIVALLISAGFASEGALAATANANFDVTVALTTQCRVASGSATALGFGTYTAFQGTALAATPATITFECTRGLAAPTIAFNSGVDMTTSAAGATATGEGVVGGLRYTLAVGAATVTAGTAATTTAIGTAATYAHSITGSIPANQAGTSGAATTQARSLVITY